MQIRAAAIRGIDRLIDDLGGDGAALLAEFGVSPADLDSEHGLLPTATAGRILRGATRRLNCPDFGLRLAAYQDMLMLSPLALAVGNCDTVGEGLDCASRFLNVHNQGIRLSRAQDPEHYAGVGAVEYRMLHPDIPYEPQTIDAGLGLLHRDLITMSAIARPSTSRPLSLPWIEGAALTFASPHADVQLPDPTGRCEGDPRHLP